MRADVRWATERAAVGERRHNGTRIALVSDEIARELLAEWSEPVQVRAQETSGGLLELHVRKAEVPE